MKSAMLKKLAIAAVIAATPLTGVSALPDGLAAPTPKANASLLGHQKRFDGGKVITVQNHIHVAYGFDMCNMIFVEGPDGLIVVDTGLNMTNAAAALAAIRKITKKPIKAIFYSHGHGDHVGGVGAFVADSPDAKIYAAENWDRNIDHIASAVRPTHTVRAAAQLGLVLPEGLAGTVGSGGGPVLRLGGKPSYIAPTHTAADGDWLEIAGLRLQVLSTPGDLDDGITLWFPDTRAALTGDTLVAMPLHVIQSTPRHEPGRDAQAYVDSITKIGLLKPAIVIGGHGDVVEDADNVAKLVRAERRAAQYVLDQVMREIRANKSGDDVQAAIAYPNWFLEGHDRRDHYHKLSWIARGVYAQYMGWFTGDATSLAPVTPADRARHIVAGFGGQTAAIDAAAKAYQAGEFHWAAELAGYIQKVDPTSRDANIIKAWSLEAIAYDSESANERNYLLTQAYIMKGQLSLAKIQHLFERQDVPPIYKAASSKTFLHTLGARLDMDKARGKFISIAIKVTDRDTQHFVEIDNGVLLASPAPLSPPSLTIGLTHMDLARAAEGKISWQDLAHADRLDLTGNKEDFDHFIALF